MKKSMVELLAQAKKAKHLILAAVIMNAFIFWIRERTLLSLALPSTLIGLCPRPQGPRQ